MSSSGKIDAIPTPGLEFIESYVACYINTLNVAVVVPMAGIMISPRLINALTAAWISVDLYISLTGDQIAKDTVKKNVIVVTRTSCRIIGYTAIF